MLAALLGCAPAPAFPKVTEPTCTERSFHFSVPEANRLYFWSQTAGTVKVYVHEGAYGRDPLYEVEAATCVEAKSFVCTDLETLMEQSLGCP